MSKSDKAGPDKEPKPPKLQRSCLDEARWMIEEYAADLREIIRQLHRRLLH